MGENSAPRRRYRPRITGTWVRPLTDGTRHLLTQGLSPYIAADQAQASGSQIASSDSSSLTSRGR